MPKELFELKKFDKGIVSTPSHEDTHTESATYSLDLEVKSVDGKLQGRKDDVQLVADKGKIDKAVFIDNPDNTKKDLIYISDDNLKSSADFYGSTSGGEADVDHGDIGASSSNAMTVNNKEVHIGTGNTDLSKTKWTGYTQSTQFDVSIDEKIVENDELAKITTLPSFSQSIEDANHIFAINQDGTKIIKVDKATYTFVESDYTFERITAICLQGPKNTHGVTGENLWIFDSNRGGENAPGGIGLIKRSDLTVKRWNDLITDYGMLDGFIVSDMIDNQEYLHIAFFKDNSTSNYVGPYFNSTIKNAIHPDGEVKGVATGHEDDGGKLKITTNNDILNYFKNFHPTSTNGTQHNPVGMAIEITGAGTYDNVWTIHEVTNTYITFAGGVTYNSGQDITSLVWSMPGVPSDTHRYNGKGDLKCFPLMARFDQISGGTTNPSIKGQQSGHGGEGYTTFKEAHPIANNQPLEARAISNYNSGDANDIFANGYYSTLGNIYKSENGATEQDYHDVYLFAKTLKFPFVPANANNTYTSGATRASFYYMFKELKNGTSYNASSEDEIHVTIYDDGGTPTNRVGRPPSYDFEDSGDPNNPAPYPNQKAQTDNYECWTQPIKSTTQKNLTGILMMSNWTNDGTRAWNAWNRNEINIDMGTEAASGHGTWWVEKTTTGSSSEPNTIKTRYDEDHNIEDYVLDDDVFLQAQFGCWGMGGHANADKSKLLNHNKWGKPINIGALEGGEEDLNGAQFPGNITTFADGPAQDTSDTTITTSQTHGLSNGDKINIHGTTNYNGREIVVTVDTTTEFSIPKAYVAETGTTDKSFRLPTYPITFYISGLGLTDPLETFNSSHTSGGNFGIPFSSITGFGTTISYNALGVGQMKVLQDLRRIPMGHILAADLGGSVNGRTYYPVEDTNFYGGTKTFYDMGNSYKDADGSCAIMMAFKYDDIDISGSWDLQSKNDNISQFIVTPGNKADYIFTGESADDDLLHQAFFPNIWSIGDRGLNHENKSSSSGMLQQPRGVGFNPSTFTDITMTQIADVADNLSIDNDDYGNITGDTAMFSNDPSADDARIHVWDNTRLMSFEQTQGDNATTPATFGTGTPRAQSLLAPFLTQSSNLTALPGLLEPGRWSTFGFSFEYDGYQEGPISALGSKEEGAYIDENNISQGEEGYFIGLQLTATNLSKRISAVNVYVAEATDAGPGQGGLFRLITRIPTNVGWSTGSETFWGDTYTLKEDYQWRGQRGSTYESLTGIPEAIKRTMVNYNLSAELNNTLFVTDVYHQDLTTSGNYVIRSLPYKYSMFDVVHDRLILPEKPTAIASFAGRIWVFSENNTYKIEPNNFYIEDTFNGVGCASQNSIVVTEYGMCFADSNNVYLHDGNFPKPIGEPILKMEYDSTDYGYKSMYDSSSFKPFALFDGKSGSFMIIMSNRHALIYNVLRKKWDLWTTPGSITTQVGTPDFYTAFSGKDGQVYMSKKHDEASTDVIPLFAYASHVADEMPWKWVSKKLTMGQSTQDKKFYESNLIGTGALTELEGDSGSLNPNGFPHKSRSLKITAEGSNGDTIDAIGLIFRRYIKVFKGVSG